MELTMAMYRQAADCFDTTVCLCGGNKPQDRSFCSDCLHALPHSVKQLLYAPGDDYIEGFHKAYEYLRLRAGRINPRPYRKIHDSGY